MSTRAIPSGSIVISDSQAALSIERWSDQEHRNVSPSTPPRSTYRMAALTGTSGSSYVDLLTLYRRCWSFARLAGEHKNMRAAAERMQRLLRSYPGSSEAHMTTLDVLDKLLWLANGNLTALGLAGG